MKKDEESLLRMNFLVQAARIYANSAPEYSSHFIYDFLQISEKKMIRIDKQLKKKIDKKRFCIKGNKHLAKFMDEERLKQKGEGEIEEKMDVEGNGSG